MLTERQRQKRRERKAQQRRAKLRQQQSGPPPSGRAPMVMFRTGLPKMSDLIVEFAEPFLATLPMTDVDWKDGLYVAAIVWNGIVTGQSSEEIVAQLRRGLDPAIDVVELVGTLTKRKQLLFPDDDRFIFGLETKRSGDRVDVSAVSGFAR